LLIGYKRDMPTPPANPGHSPFVSAVPSRAASSTSIYHESHDHLSPTGLDGAGCGTVVEIAEQKRSAPAPGPAERPTRSLARRSRATFTSSLGHSIVEE
jgi:hypothetical protein